MKKIVIIGAGISGLSAGVYARQSGFDVTIYESHTIPGGASTSWRRKGYLFEGGMHWLTGSSPKTALNTLWREVGALDDSVTIYNRDPFFQIETGGQTVCFYRDIERLRRHFLEISPEDKTEINVLCRDIRKFEALNIPVTDIKGLSAKNPRRMPLSAAFGVLPAIPRLSFYSKMSAAEYAQRFKSPALRETLSQAIGPDFSSVGLLATLATHASGDGGYPVGGSLAMAGRMAEKFKELGGIIQYNTVVHRVNVRDGTAVGVELDSGPVEADAVIITRDTLTAIDRLFEAPIHEPWAERMRKATTPTLDTFISVGVETDLSGFPENSMFVSETPLVCGGIKNSVIGLNLYANGSFPSYAPEGCTAVTSSYVGDTYDFWKTCSENGTYAAEKEKLANAFIDLLAKRIPQTAGKVVVWDVATPLTYERYLHSYKGSWMSVMGKGPHAKPYPCQPKGLRDVYFAGQRLQVPGGLPVALTTGRSAVQYLCRDTNTVFQGAI